MSLVVNAVDGHEAYFRHTVVGRWECEELIAVVLRVAESDEAFVLAAVVPFELVFAEREGDAVVEDALHVVDVGFFLIDVRRGEEVGGGHLLAVAHDDKGIASGDSADGFARGNLRCFVENYQVEFL